MPRSPARPSSAPRSDIVVYEAGADTRLEVRTDGETVWLTQDQMCKLFGRERSVITKHIRNVFKEGMSYLVRQLSAPPPPPPPKPRIGFAQARR